MFSRGAHPARCGSISIESRSETPQMNHIDAAAIAAYQRGDLEALKSMMTVPQLVALHHWCVKVAVRKSYEVLPLFEAIESHSDAPRKALEAAEAWLADPASEAAMVKVAERDVAAYEAAEMVGDSNRAVAAGTAAITARCARMVSIWLVDGYTHGSPLGLKIQDTWSHTWFEAVEAWATAANANRYVRLLIDLNDEREWQAAKKWSRHVGRRAQLRAAYTIIQRVYDDVALPTPTLSTDSTMLSTYDLTRDFMDLYQQMTWFEQNLFHAWGQSTMERWYARRGIPYMQGQLNEQHQEQFTRWFQGPFQRGKQRAAAIILRRGEL